MKRYGNKTDKRLAKRTKLKQTAFNASITGVYPKRTHGFGVYDCDRVAWAVRVDSKLLNEAKPVLKAKYGSFCRGVEVWLAGLVAVSKGEQLSGVCPSNTVEIGKLVIERNLRSRRKLVVEEETEVSQREIPICSWKDCGKPAEFYAVLNLAVHKGRLTKAMIKDSHACYCREHLDFQKARGALSGWSEIHQ